MIDIQNVSKRYPTGILANQNISFQVLPGEIVALVGPNGCGKTTLFQQILGIIRNDQGSILVDGKEHNVKNIAYMPQFPAIYPALTVEETLLATAKYLGIPSTEQNVRVEKVLVKVGLKDKASQATYTLSGGQKKLLAFGCMLVQNAKYLVMDEVTSMVDVLTKELIWKLILEEKSKGRAILLSSHDLSEVKKLCTKLVVMQRGQVIFCGSPEEIKEAFCRCMLCVEDVDKTIELLNQFDCQYTYTESSFSIITSDLKQMIRFLATLEPVVVIRSFSCEHPAFYDGLIAMLKNGKREGLYATYDKNKYMD